MLGTLALSTVAGSLSTLSPCVLPLVPVVLGAAASEHRWGPAALAAGLALSFAAIGTFAATAGRAIGLDADSFRVAGAILVIGIGVVLLLPALQMRAAAFAAPVGTWVETRFGDRPTAGLGGQFGVGLLLGAVWSPCVGPTLGAATLLASRGESLGAVALTMLAFGVGAALPLLALGALSREALLRWKGRLALAGRGGKAALGALLVAIGVLVLSGLDKRAEAWVVERSPDWLIALTTGF